jgi:hypothetical protein
VGEIIMANKHENIFLTGSYSTLSFTSKRPGGGSFDLPSRNRTTHGERIKRKLESVWEKIDEKNEEKNNALFLSG